MKNINSLTPISTVMLVCVLTACSEPADKQVDFSVPADQNAASSAPADYPSGTVLPAQISYEDRRVPLVATKECNLERANGVVFAGEPITASRAGPLRLSGWVADTEQNIIPATADLRFTGTADNRAWKVAIQPGSKRDDVVALLGGNTAFANSGYGVEVDVRGLPAGSYRMFVVYSAGSGRKSCDNGRSIVITD